VKEPPTGEPYGPNCPALGTGAATEGRPYSYLGYLRITPITTPWTLTRSAGLMMIGS
jgi:hypothetical protein